MNAIIFGLDRTTAQDLVVIFVRAILTHTCDTSLTESLEQHHFHIKTDEVNQARNNIWSACYIREYKTNSSFDSSDSIRAWK